jgi:predicted AAA+ superfamily ATPase
MQKLFILGSFCIFLQKLYIIKSFCIPLQKLLIMVKREYYEETLDALKDKHLIKVITGIRRCGKSTLLEMYRDKLKKEGNNTIYYNFEDAANIALQNWKVLHDEVMAQTISDKMNYVFLDEIQAVDEFEKMVDSLFVKKNIDLYITGSNAFILSSGLATLLSGRYFEINILPFSFKEYKQILPNSSLSNYLIQGGMPGALDLYLTSESLALKYLRDVYNSVVVQDIINHSKITNTQELFAVTRFAFDITGCFLSPNNVSNSLKQENKKVDSRLVFRLLEALKESFVLYESKRYDIKGKAQLQTISKFYLCDTGFRRMLIGKPTFADVGHLLENVVYLELLRRGYNVWTGKYGENEIDFVARNAGGVIEYYQVAYTVKETTTFDREMLPLKNIRDNYRKILLTTDDFEFDEDGIEQLNVEKWLLNN